MRNVLFEWLRFDCHRASIRMPCRLGKSIVPAEVMSLGLGVSVLVGLVSGVCYVMVHKQRAIKAAKNRKWYCNVCGAYLRSIENVLQGNKYVVCSVCEGKVCKVKCSKRRKRGEWTCQTCYAQSKAWFNGILKNLQPLSELISSSKMAQGRIDEADEDLEELQNREREQVREFIESIVNNMLGANVDDASINKIYNDPKYLPVSGQSPCSIHTSLKQLIQRIIREASKLPKLQKEDDAITIPTEESENSYEDLLSTAILNKVISDSQNRLPSSSANSVSSRQSTSSRVSGINQEFSFGEETLDRKWKNPDELTSLSSLEEWLQNGSTKYVDHKSLRIQDHIDEGSSASESDNEDSVYFRTNSALSNDTSNWYLQRKQFTGNHSPIPVPMLVPNPTTEAKVLIGDKEVDETSDLSDAASDYGDLDVPMNIESHLIENKTLIGGKNIFLHENGHISDDEVSADSGVKEGKDFDEIDHGDNLAFPDIHHRNVEPESMSSNISNPELDSEYTEKYASLPRTIYKTSTPSKESCYIINNESTTEKQEDMFDDDEEASHFEGSYSKKEKEKWKNAIEMKNNPYSKENIEKRISSSRNSVNSIYGTDYYIKQASVPSGKRKSDEEVSLSQEIEKLEGKCTYSSLPRSLYNARNSSKNFVKNPLLNFPENYNSL